MIDTGFFDNLGEYFIDGTHNNFMQALKANRLFSIHNPRNDILPIADLAVEFAVLGQDISADQINHLTVEGGRSDIHGNRINTMGGVARLHIDHARFADIADRPHQRGGDFKILLADDVRYFANNRQGDIQTMFIILGF